MPSTYPIPKIVAHSLMEWSTSEIPQTCFRFETSAALKSEAPQTVASSQSFASFKRKPILDTAANIVYRTIYIQRFL